MNQIKNSVISWQANTPFSEQFADYYYNSDGGIEETLHVFIDPSNVANKYRDTAADFFNINETGFGTGLNFYCTLLAIQSLTQLSPTKPLYFYSSELFPLSIVDFKQSASRFPQFADITSQICQQYPPAIKGFHRIILNRGAVYLTLIFDDSTAAYQQCNHPVDVWYLDGFSPAKNAAMWQPELFQQIAKLSHLNTSLATFTAAGFVRRALQAQGFSVEKHSGFGKKRESITGRYTHDASHLSKAERAKPWFTVQKPQTKAQNVAVIGAGLAGCTTAEALARRGINVTLYDESDAICTHASGNLQAALYAKLPSKPTLGGEFHLTGLEYSLRLLEIYQCFDNKIAQQCGLLQLAVTEKETKQQQDLLTINAYSSDVVHWVDAEQASKLTGSTTLHSGLFFPRAGWVAPALFCEQLIQSSFVQLELNTTIEHLEQLTNKEWALHLRDKEGHHRRATYDAVVVANANSAKQLEPFKGLCTKAIRGQVTHASSNASTVLKTVVCGAGYISPAVNNQYCFGASFDLHHQDTELKEFDQQINIQNLSKVLPELAAHLSLPTQLCGKVAQRCSTPDYLPMVGPAPISDLYVSKYKKLNKDKHWRFADEAAPNYSGLYLNTGHGSKGMISCPLSAEYLACLITNQPSPLPINLSNALHPARFIIKQLIRRAI